MRAAWRRREAIEGYLFLAPAVLIIGAFHVWPALYVFYMSLFRWDILQGAFLGLRNYEHLLQDADFLRSLVLTLVYVVGTVPLEMAGDHLPPAAHGISEHHTAGAGGLRGERFRKRAGNGGAGPIGEVGSPLPPAQRWRSCLRPRAGGAPVPAPLPGGGSGAFPR